MATELAKAYVQIIPSAHGIKGNLEKELGAESDKAGKTSGGKFASAFKTGLGALVKTTGAMIAGVGTMSAVLVKATSDAAAHGDEIDKMSQKLGLSASAYQEWDYVLGQAGVDITSMSTGLKTLTNKIDDAKNGGKDAQKMFEALGLSMEDLSNMSREDIFEAAIAGFQRMADSTERAALANDLFGKSGQELAPLFNETTEATDSLRKAAHDLGFVMSDEAVSASAKYNDALDTLNRTMGGLKTNMMTELMPSITQVMDGLTQIFGGDKDTGLAMISEGISGLAQKITEAMPGVVAAGGEILSALVTAIMDNMPKIVEAAVPVITAFVMGIIEHLPELIKAGIAMLKELVQAISDNIDQIIDAAFEIIFTLAEGLIENLPTMIPQIVEIIIHICETLIDHVDDLIDAAVAILMALTEGIIEAIPILTERAPELIIKLVAAIIRSIPKLIEAAVAIVVKLASGIVENLPKIVEAGKKIISKIGEGISSLWATVKNWASSIIGKIKEGFASAWSRVKEIGKNLLEGIWNGISGAASWLWGKIKGWAESLLGGIKDLFGISSPSKVTAGFGRFLALGLGEGFGDSIGLVSDQIEAELSELTNKSARITADVTATTSGIYDTQQNRSRVADLLHSILATLQDLVSAAQAGHVIVLDDGTLVGVVDHKLGVTAARKARGN